jgi:hypothetical protein
MLLAATASAAVPDATLAAFGLGGMQQMTDAQGLNVRGMGGSVSAYSDGYALSTVTVTTTTRRPTTTTTLTVTAFNESGASATGYKHTALAVSGSVAAVGGAGSGGSISWVVIGAGGVGGAYAKGT